ncbi:aminoglycoside phosphotransferase family protein [Planomicrobium sp. MB-3u-38]|uniref:aminoglycoside phosphotransferase family protein n=1 Tax=Planomicrobium sp. MB-3u-38 TaxID=2058318 RepID=UPI001E2C912C|nr:aminoglycoside phosphotransferase family protein [Planomicrobium sp. MB-3u-38]
MIEILARQIPYVSDFEKIIQIKKGYSSDEKYLIHMPDDQGKLFLRIYKPEQLDAKKSEYALLEKMQDYGVASLKPIAIGKTMEKGYMITSYIEGNDAGEEISAYSEQEQYDLGIAAGKELKKMHQYAAPETIAPWHSRKIEKHRKYLDAYLSCGIKVKNDKQIMDFIDENIHLMEQRPNLFQHDDFHLGNLIVKNKKLAGVIDFDRYDWGDPIHEFLKIGIFSRGISVPFSRGQIKGYFQGEEPGEEFWRLYSLYMAMCVFSSVIWTLNTIPEETNDMLQKIDTFLDDHDYFSRLQPKWYNKLSIYE